MMIFWGLLLLIMIIVIVKAVTSNSTQSGGESLMAILKRRYARGEIDKEEFEKRKKESHK